MEGEELEEDTSWQYVSPDKKGMLLALTYCIKHGERLGPRSPKYSLFMGVSWKKVTSSVGQQENNLRHWGGKNFDSGRHH